MLKKISGFILFTLLNLINIRLIYPPLGKVLENLRMMALRWQGAEIDKESFVRSFAQITSPKNLMIGKNSKINNNAKLYLFEKLTIGNNVEIGPEFLVYTGEHKIDDSEKPLAKQGNYNKPVIIEDDVYIGARVTILKGVTISSRVVVAAGAVVTENLVGGVYIWRCSSKTDKEIKSFVMSSNTRLIARLDVKGPSLIKSINLEGIRKIGDPNKFAQRYYEQGADEIIYMDMVASLYGRNNLHDIVTATAKNVFVPITAGGGVRNVEDAETLLHSGADKVAVNTVATQKPELISDIATRFGSQCMVLSIEAKKQDNGTWEAYVDCGRERSGLDAVQWAKKGSELGAGEILVTSIDQEGTRQGFDTELVRQISDAVNVPVIASGGFW